MILEYDILPRLKAGDSYGAQARVKRVISRFQNGKTCCGKRWSSMPSCFLRRSLRIRTFAHIITAMARRKNVIELLTFWIGSKVESSIPLSECAIPDFVRQPGRITGFYGYSHKGNGSRFVYGFVERESAKAKSAPKVIVPVIVDVHLEHDIKAEKITPENLVSGEYDFANTERCDRDVINDLYAFWLRYLAKGRFKGNLEGLKRLRATWPPIPRAADFISADETAVSALLDTPPYNNLRLFVYPARPQTSSDPRPWFLVGTTLPDNIVDARSPGFPGITILPDR